MKSLSQQRVQDLFLKFCKAYGDRDFKIILNLFSSKGQMWSACAYTVHIGHEEIEKELKRNWMEAETGELEVISWLPSSSKNTEWAAALCRASILIDGILHVSDNLRVSVVCEEEDGTLKISHMHASFPD